MGVLLDLYELLRRQVLMASLLSAKMMRAKIKNTPI